MLMVLSPAKRLDFDSAVRTALSSEPVFPEQTLQLVRHLQTIGAQGMANLMGLSDALAKLNQQRYASWQDTPDSQHARQAVLAFAGDVYAGLRADELSDEQLSWAQNHLAILSGLYGLLRPLDLVQPHRLEMGTRLAGDHGNNLYDFWGDRIAQELNQRLDALSGERLLLNLASREYFRAIDLEVLRARIVDCVFQDLKNGHWKVISFHAKKARGLMARFVIEEKIETEDELQAFAADGYRHEADISAPGRLVFRRQPEKSADLPGLA